MNTQTLSQSIVTFLVSFVLVACGAGEKSQDREQHGNDPGDIGDTTEIDGLNLTGQEKDQIKADLGSLAKRLPALEKKAQDVADQCFQFAQDLSNAQASLGELAADRVGEEQQVAALDQEKTSLEEQLKALKGPMATMRGEIAALESALASVGPEYKAKINKAMKDIAAELAQLRAELTAQKKEYDNATDEGDADKMSAINTSLIELNDKIQDGESKKATSAALLKRDGAALKLELQTQIAEKKTALKDYTAANHAAIADLRTAASKATRALGVAKIKLTRSNNVAKLKVAVLPDLCTKILK